jgi:LDH2 family malate/lactate/ureidoglycolate dehydrogenase
MTRVAIDKLTSFICDLFAAADVPEADAGTIADMTVGQEMRGIVTHGLRHVDTNLQGLASGGMNPKPDQPVLRDQGMTAVIEGDHGVGMVACMKAMRLAIQKASQGGIGMVLAVRNNHFLSATPYCLEAVKAGAIGIAFSNTQASMGYPGTHARVIGNSPIGFGVPTAAGFPILFDSCLTTSGGKLHQWIREGKRIPASLLGVDKDGNASDDPEAVLFGGTPMPIGGHKGGGLSLLIEVLSGILGGAAFLSGIVPPDEREDKHQAESQCCIAVNVESFMPLRDFESRMAEFISDLKGSPLAKDTDEIRVPGERMMRSTRECEANGVPLEPDVEEGLRGWAEQLGVEFPV